MRGRALDDPVRLRWIMRNRARRETEERAGTLVRHLIEEVWTKDGQPALQVAGVIGRVVDDTFRKHCRVGSLQGGSLGIYVDEPSLVSAMRRRWSSRLVQVMAAQGGCPSANRIVFEYGMYGTTIAEAEAHRTG